MGLDTIHCKFFMLYMHIHNVLVVVVESLHHYMYAFSRGNDSMPEDQALTIFNGALEIEAKHSMLITGIFKMSRALIPLMCLLCHTNRDDFVARNPSQANFLLTMGHCSSGCSTAEAQTDS